MLEISNLAQISKYYFRHIFTCIANTSGVAAYVDHNSSDLVFE